MLILGYVEMKWDIWMAQSFNKCNKDIDEITAYWINNYITLSLKLLLEPDFMH